MTPNYEYIQKLIKDTLANKPIGHEITPEEHQNIELALLEFAKNLELIQVGTLIGFANANTVPVQPNGTNAAYLNTMTNSTTVVFNNFRDVNGRQISVTTDSEHVAFNVLFWNAGNKNQRNGWSIYTIQIPIITISDLSYILEKITLQEDITTNITCGGIEAGTLLPAGTELKQIITDMVYGNSTIIPWGENSDLNNYTETGIYHFEGYRTNANDNLPIENVDAKANIAFTLIVDKSEGYLEENDGVTTHVPTIVSQTLFLGNRQGSETRAYVRNCTMFFDGQPDNWERWHELMQTTYLGVLRETHEGETLKSVRENGLYTGAFFYPSSTFDIFKLEVMNNYAIADLYGGTNTVFQKITILQINGDDKELTRRRRWNADINDYEWTPWEEITDEDKQDLVAGAVENNVATFGTNGQVKDSGVKAGGAEFVEDIYKALTVIGGEATYYTTIQGMVIPVGTTVYSDAAWTNEVGTVTAAMSSGQYSVTLDSGEDIRVYENPYTKPSDKTLATEAGVMKAIQSNSSHVSTPDWNQNDETATDYIKNRTHYEAIAEHVEMTDNEYDAKVASGSTFVQVQMNSVTVENNEYLKDKNTETGSRQEYNSILSALSAGSDGSVFKNGTSTCKKIAINGIKTSLEYLEHPQGSPFYDREGVLGSTFYGADGTADTTQTNVICCYGNGFMLKYYCYVGYSESYFLFLIDTSIYGEAPYTIDFYFECEQTIKKLDEKFLPNGIVPKRKTGDVVVCINRDGDGVFKVISWEEYESNTLNYPDVIGLVADPVKRTFLFCELLNKPFASIANIKKYLYGYTSLMDGQDTYRRLSVGGNIDGSFPAFYDLRCVSKTGTVFYQKQFNAYTPALFEWEKVYNPLCKAFYDDPVNMTGAYASQMDRLIALKNGTEPKQDTFFYIDPVNGFHSVYYAQLSSVGLLGIMDNYPYNDIAPFNTMGSVPGFDTLNYNLSPVFGLYTEDEE